MITQQQIQEIDRLSFMLETIENNITPRKNALEALKNFGEEISEETIGILINKAKSEINSIAQGIVSGLEG